MAGMDIKVQNQDFVLRYKKHDFKSLLLYGVLGAVVVILIASQIFRRASDSTTDSVVGIVTDQSSGAVLSDVKVTINELGKTVVTDRDGIFLFEMLPHGSYTISTYTPFYKQTGIAFHHEENRQTILAIKMEETIPDAGNEPSNKEQSAAPTQEELKYGDLRIESNVEHASIILDRKAYGQGSRTIPLVMEGRHRLAVKADGYEPFEQTVTVNGDETTTIQVALTKIQEAAPPEPNAAERVEAGRAAYAAKNFHEAVEFFSLALMKEKDAETYFMRGQAFYGGGRTADARKDYMQAGKLYAEKGQVGKAISAYSAVLDMMPQDQPALRARGYSHIQRGEYEKGLADFEAVCNIDGESYANLLGLGDAYSAMGKYKDAIKYYKKAEERTDDKGDVFALLALASLARGKEGDAKKYYARFLETASEETEKRFASDPEWQRLRQLASN